MSSANERSAAMCPPYDGPVWSPDLLRGKRALVTGGGTGLGRAIADGLAEAGADLLLAARRVEVLDEAAEEIRQATGRKVDTCFVDIRDREAIEALAARAAELGGVDALVNNAGGQFAAPASEIRPKGWNAVIETNLTGTWNMTQVFGAAMLEGAGGSIVQVVALLGRGFPGIAHTAAARAGVLELSRTLAYEWGPKVRVNCVAPGPVGTPGFEKTYPPGVLKAMQDIPLPRPGSPREIANVAVFLASPAASYVTGECFSVAGGQQIQGRNQVFARPKFGVVGQEERAARKG